MTWFARHARDLPWRADRDPYHIWVSEVMLQQTTVATVSTRFRPFLDRFPSIVALAAADEQEVLRAWEGLGYYSRARNLHRAARILVEHHAGQLPNDVDVVAELPGIGRYMLGAILSQAFDVRLPIVEANTKRVLARLFGREGDLSSPDNQAWLWETAAAILPRSNIGNFNQAMMELGATVCTVDQPRCDRCPFREDCQAFRDNRQHQLPERSARARPTTVHELAIKVTDRDRLLLVRRPATGRWANMWEMPRTELLPQETTRDAAVRLMTTLGLPGEPGAPVATTQYAVTRFRVQVSWIEVECRLAGDLPDYDGEWAWVAVDQLEDYPLSSPQRKFLRQLGSSRADRDTEACDDSPAS